MRYGILLLAGLVAAGLRSAPAAAQSGPPPPMARAMMDDAAMRAIAALLHADDLSDEQRGDLHAVLDADRASVEPIVAQLSMANETFLDQLLSVDGPSVDALNASIERVTVLRRQLLQQQVQTVLSLRETLAPEQLEQAARSASASDDVVFLRR